MNSKQKNNPKRTPIQKARPSNKDVIAEIADLKNIMAIQANYMKQLVELTWAGLDPNIKRMVSSKEPEKEDPFTKVPMIAHIYSALDYYIAATIGRPEIPKPDPKEETKEETTPVEESKEPEKQETPETTPDLISEDNLVGSLDKLMGSNYKKKTKPISSLDEVKTLKIA